MTSPMPSTAWTTLWMTMHDHTELTQDRIGHLKERLEREITKKICPLLPENR